MRPKLSAFPKCYLDRIAGDHTMTVFEWIEMARPLDADGLEMYEGFFTSLDDAYLDEVGEAIHRAGCATRGGQLVSRDGVPSSRQTGGCGDNSGAQ